MKRTSPDLKGIPVYVVYSGVQGVGLAVEENRFFPSRTVFLTVEEKQTRAMLVMLMYLFHLLS